MVTSNIHGGSASIALNLNRWFGVVGDFGGSKISELDAGSLGSVTVDGTLFTYLFGPRFSYREHETLTPFAQVLVGGAHLSNISSGGITYLTSENAFAMTAGGGLDIKVHKNVAIRPFQFEYLMTRFTDISSPTGATGTQNHMRLSAGIVFRLGER